MSALVALAGILSVCVWAMWPLIRPMPADPWEAAALTAWREQRRGEW